MKVHLKRNSRETNKVHMRITGSKSESNRLLVLQALFPNIVIENLSDSDDTRVLKDALNESPSGTKDIHHAGTSMRFLTAYFAAYDGAVVTLTGSERMKQRPISILVDALLELGADITYLENDGFPPLQIRGKQLEGGALKIRSDVSSQYITALLLIAPQLKKGLKLQLEGSVTSKPYVAMTCRLLEQIGCEVSYTDGAISVAPMPVSSRVVISVESDWSSASYFFSAVALAENLTLQLEHYRNESLQGDSQLVSIFNELGVYATFNDTEGTLTITREGAPERNHLQRDLRETPDIAQTLAVCCFGLGMTCEFTGLHTLKIKETDRLVALKNELEKLGAAVAITDDSLSISDAGSIRPGMAIETYNDHRMAMAFAPLALRTKISILDANVVSKSYPNFWQDLSRTGVQLDFER